MPLDVDILPALAEALAPPPRLVSRTAAPFRAAVAVLLRDPAAQPELLFIQRAEHPRDPWSGHMAFPGGRMDPADPDERAVAERETAEEIGLSLPRHGRLLGRLDEVQARAREGRLPLGIAPFVYCLDQAPPLSLSDEVQSVLWIPLVELFAPRNRQTIDYAMGGQTYTLPSIQFQGKVIWGLTLRILGDLLYRLAAGPIEPWLRRRLQTPAGEPLLPDLDALLREAAVRG